MQPGVGLSVNMSFDTLARWQRAYSHPLRLGNAFMHASYLRKPTPAKADGLAVADWDCLFGAVLTRLRDTVARDASGHPACAVVLECVDALEQLRRSHPSA